MPQDRRAAAGACLAWGTRCGASPGVLVQLVIVVVRGVPGTLAGRSLERLPSERRCGVMVFKSSGW